MSPGSFTVSPPEHEGGSKREHGTCPHSVNQDEVVVVPFRQRPQQPWASVPAGTGEGGGQTLAGRPWKHCLGSGQRGKFPRLPHLAAVFIQLVCELISEANVKGGALHRPEQEKILP